MVIKEKLERKLKVLKPFLKKEYKVKELMISDPYRCRKNNVNLVVEFSGNICWEFLGLKRLLERNLNVGVNLITVQALKSEDIEI